MNNISYTYDKLPGFSKLFCDFINGVHFFDERFPNNKKLFNDAEFLKVIAEKYKNREKIVELIECSTLKINLNSTQKDNLNSLRNKNSLTIVTGQQVGFLGGPLYTIIKISTAINLSEKLNQKYPNFHFVPIFWIEDNDHDNLEASQAVVFNHEYNVVHLSCMDGLSNLDRTCVSERIFDNTLLKSIEKLETILPPQANTIGIIDKLKDIYRTEKYWNDSFIELLNSWFGNTGLLFIKASEARKSGLFKELVLKEFENIGETKNIINASNIKIESKGYHIQAKSFDINVFVHDGDKRFKLVRDKADNSRYECGQSLYSIEELRNKAEKEPHSFSPAVLLRPVFQDYILPTAVYVGGPSEIGYSCQIKELYEYFGVQMPAILPRHSASFNDIHTRRFLEKQNLEPVYFTRKFIEIEKDLNHILFDKEVEKVFEKARNQIKGNYDEIMEVTSKIDATLIRTGASACHKSLENLDWLEKKINSAQRKINQLVYENYKQASNFNLPEGTIQERMYSAINFMCITGEEKFLKLIDEFTKGENDRHFYMKLSEI